MASYTMIITALLICGEFHDKFRLWQAENSVSELLDASFPENKKGLTIKQRETEECIHVN